MEIQFRTRKLKRQYEAYGEACKAYGEEAARRYVLRVNIVREARDLADLEQAPGLRCHPLKGNRQGEWSIRLTGFWRLIFTLHGERLQVVRIEEVSKHYDD